MDNENTNQTPESAPTIRLKPIVIKPRTGTSVDADAAAKPSIPGVVPRVVAATPVNIVQNWDGKTEGAPLAPTSAPAGDDSVESAPVEAAKSKTSRISLDAALVGGEVRPTGPKTIRLKRPTGVSIPAAAAVTPAVAATDGGTGTLKLKKTDAEVPEGAIALEGEGNIVLSGGDAGVGGPEKVNVLFPLVAAASIIVLLATVFVLGFMQ